MSYGDFTDLPGRPTAAKAIHDKAFNIAKNPKYNGVSGWNTSMVSKYFDKKSVGGAVKGEIMSKQRTSDLYRVGKISDRTRELPEELHKPIIKEFEKRKVYSPFKDNI